MVVETWLREVDRLDAEIAVQTRELERLAAADVRARWLQTVPGIGAYSAMVMLAEMGDDHQLARTLQGAQPLLQCCGLIRNLPLSQQLPTCINCRQVTKSLVKIYSCVDLHGVPPSDGISVLRARTRKVRLPFHPI